MLKNYSRQILSSNIDLSRNSEAIRDLAVLDYIVELDFPQYSQKRLDSRIRAMFTKIAPEKGQGKPSPSVPASIVFEMMYAWTGKKVLLKRELSINNYLLFAK